MARLPEWSDPQRRDAALVRVAERLTRPDPLTRQELAVVYLLSQGYSYTRIGEALYMTRNTVKRHVEMTNLKLGARSSTEAVAKALRSGLIS